MELSNGILALLHSDLEKGVHVQIANQVAKLEAMAVAVGDGGDLEEAAQLLQDATNIHGVNQSFADNPYAMSDRLRKMAKAIAALKEN